jgi:hypothetical protein
MAKATVEVLIDDLDGSEGAETIRLGWNGEWRELELSTKNLTSLSKTLDKYWDVARSVPAERQSRRRRRPSTPAAPRAAKRRAKAARDPKLIRAWATDNGISVPARGRIPGAVERQYNEANGRL